MAICFAAFSLVALSLSGFALAGRFQHPGIGLNREQGDYWMRPANWGGIPEPLDLEWLKVPR